MKWNRAIAVALAVLSSTAVAQTATPTDKSPHNVQFVTVDKEVKLEVLDWGGTGPPLVFVPGGDGVAHIFDNLALKFTANHHVYAITRRGYAPSSVPPATPDNYDPDRLGDDVLAVLSTLKIEKPFLAGHSVGGQELSSIGSRHPEYVAGLIYLDAAWEYAFYDEAHPDIWIESARLKRELNALMPLQSSPFQTEAALDRIETDLSKLKASIGLYRERLKGMPELKPPLQNAHSALMDTMFGNPRPYGASKVPILAIMAVPARCMPVCGTAAEKTWADANEAQAHAFTMGNPGAKIVRLPYADHAVWRSNEADVLREMNAFMDSSPH